MQMYRNFEGFFSMHFFVLGDMMTPEIHSIFHLTCK